MSRVSKYILGKTKKAQQKTISDQERVKNILNGNINEYSFIVEKYEKKLVGYIRNTFHSIDSDDIESILQEVFIKAYENLNSYNNKYEFSTWLYRITRNHILNTIRTNKNNKDKYLIDNNTNIQDNDKEVDVFDSISDENSDINKNYQNKEKHDKLYSILNTIDDKYREVLVLKYLEDKTYAEISDIIQIPEGTVATYITRGKKQLKGKILDGGEELLDLFGY